MSSSFLPTKCVRRKVLVVFVFRRIGRFAVCSSFVSTAVRDVCGLLFLFVLCFCIRGHSCVRASLKVPWPAAGPVSIGGLQEPILDPCFGLLPGNLPSIHQENKNAIS
jgi:hypothetical protein